MAQFAETNNRLFKDMYVCRRCEHKNRIPSAKILVKKGVCRFCNGKALRQSRPRSKAVAK